jgi:hypothetical protein
VRIWFSLLSHCTPTLIFCVYSILMIISYVVLVAPLPILSNMLFPGVNNYFTCLFSPVIINNSTSNTSSVAYISSQMY